MVLPSPSWLVWIPLKSTGLQSGVTPSMTGLMSVRVGVAQLASSHAMVPAAIALASAAARCHGRLLRRPLGCEGLARGDGMGGPFTVIVSWFSRPCVGRRLDRHRQCLEAGRFGLVDHDEFEPGGGPPAPGGGVWGGARDGGRPPRVEARRLPPHGRPARPGRVAPA